jgi:hypothetical protein
MPRPDLELADRGSCGFIFNHIFDEAVTAYSTDLEESQHFSGTFNAFAKRMARGTAQKCAVSGKQILEIGCGKGSSCGSSVASARGDAGVPARPAKDGLSTTRVEARKRSVGPS